MSVRRAVCMVIAAALIVPAMSAVAQQTADDVMANYVKAIGGKDALAKVKNRTTVGKFSLPDMGIEAKMTSFIAPPNVFTEVNVESMGMTVTRGMSDGTAWEINPMQGSRILEGAEAADMARQASIEPYSDHKNHFEKAEVKGEEDFDGKKVTVLELTPKGGGAAQTVMFDKESGLIVGTKATGPDGMEVIAKIGDYKDVGGVKIPHSIVNEGGQMNVTITLDSVEQNTDIPADKFALPAEIKALKDAPAAPAQ